MTSKVHEVRIHAQGRVVIPSDLRQHLGIAEGDTLLARVEDGRLILEQRGAVLHRLRSMFPGTPRTPEIQPDATADAVTSDGGSA